MKYLAIVCALGLSACAAPQRMSVPEPPPMPMPAPRPAPAAYDPPTPKIIPITTQTLTIQPAVVPKDWKMIGTPGDSYHYVFPVEMNDGTKCVAMAGTSNGGRAITCDWTKPPPPIPAKRPK